MKNNILDRLGDYKRLDLKWNMESMLYINKAGFLIEDIFSEENKVEALSIVMVAGRKDRNSVLIKNFLSRYISKYKELESLIMFIVCDLKDIHCFLQDKQEEYEEPLNELLVGKLEEDKPVLSHEDRLREARNNYEYIIKIYMKAGYSYEEALQKDLSNFDIINDFVIEEHENKLNDLLFIAHRVGLLSGIGFANLSKYPDKPETVRLKPLSREERIKKIEEETEKFFNDAYSEMNK